MDPVVQCLEVDGEISWAASTRKGLCRKGEWG